MKSRILYGIFLLLVIQFYFDSHAQEKLPWKNSYYKYKITHKSKQDTIPFLYCMLNVEELHKYRFIYVNYNDKVRKYTTRHILKDSTEDCSIEGNMVYFKINRSLKDPFVIMTGEDNKGHKYSIYEHNDKGELIDPVAERAKWMKAAERLDSIEYVRKFDNVYIGKDGKPRYKNNNGKTYIIERSSTRLDDENGNNQ